MPFAFPGQSIITRGGRRVVVGGAPYPGAAAVLDFEGDFYRVGGVVYPRSSVPGLTYTRTGAATAWRSDGTLAEFAPNVMRRTDAGVTIEGQRTNLAPWWDPNTAQVSLKVGCSDVGAPTIAPLSSRNWLALDNSTTAAYAYQSVTVPASTQFTAQCLVETPDGSQPVCDDGSSAATDFSLYAGGAWLQGGVASYRRLVGNVWVISVTGLTLPAPNANFGPVRQATHSKRPLKFSGFQLEKASDASSPIITTGAAATGGGDRLVLAKDLEPSADFTIIGSAILGRLAASQAMWTWTDGTLNNRILLYKHMTGRFQVYQTVGGVNTINDAADPLLRDLLDLRFAVTRKAGFMSFFINGVNHGPYPAQAVPKLTTITLGGTSVGSSTFNTIEGPLRRLAYLPYALTDAELVELTR